MLMISQGAGVGRRALSCTSAHTSPLKFTHKRSSLFFSNISKRRQSLHLSVAAKADGSSSVDSPTTTTTQTNLSNPNPTPQSVQIDFVGQENVPLEGVIQFDKPSSSSSFFDKWGRVALFAGGDVLALLIFSAIGRFSHGFSVFDFETLRTADPFIAGWFLSAYFLGGYGEDGRAMNGVSKAVVAAVKSWAVGIPLGIIIRAAASGHVPNYTFILVTMGSTAVLLVGWRALLSSILPAKQSKKDDVYRRGSPFELFELLTSLVRRW